MNPKKLNVGCGRDIKNGWVNLDSANISGVDVMHDIEKLPLPFPNETFDEILCQDVLEHVEYIPVLKDLHRILQLGGKIIIRVPHFTSKNNFIDPTHRRRFSINTFDFFVSPVRTGASRPADGNITSPLALSTCTADRSRQRSNGVKDSRLGEKRDYYFDFAFSRIVSRRITFEKSSRFFFYNKIVERCVNKSLMRQSHFESTGFSRLFPAENILVELIK